MKLRSSIHIALVLIIAIVAAAIFWLTDTDRLDPAPLTAHDPNAVDRVEIRYSDGRSTVVVERDGEAGWRIVEPLERAADATRVVGLLSLLDDRMNTCYAPNPERLAEYGLDDPTISLVVGDTSIDFGDRAAPGRRHVLAGERMCVIDELPYTTLSAGIDGIADLSLLPARAAPVAIETPGAAARDDGDGWELTRGVGAAPRWAVRWRAARASGFDFDPPDTDAGTVRVELDGGRVFEWRIAAEPGGRSDLLLVPDGASYAVRVAADDAGELLEPPSVVEDKLD